MNSPLGRPKKKEQKLYNTILNIKKDEEQHKISNVILNPIQISSKNTLEQRIHDWLDQLGVKFSDPYDIERNYFQQQKIFSIRKVYSEEQPGIFNFADSIETQTQKSKQSSMGKDSSENQDDHFLFAPDIIDNSSQTNNSNISHPNSAILGEEKLGNVFASPLMIKRYISKQSNSCSNKQNATNQDQCINDELQSSYSSTEENSSADENASLKDECPLNSMGNGLKNQHNQLQQSEGFILPAEEYSLQQSSPFSNYNYGKEVNQKNNLCDDSISVDINSKLSSQDSTPESNNKLDMVEEYQQQKGIQTQTISKFSPSSFLEKKLKQIQREDDVENFSSPLRRKKNKDKKVDLSKF